MKITNYKEFVERVNELGFMTLSDVLPGLPSLSAETNKSNWHTGNYESDPWCWKDRVAKEKKLAYGCILGGHKGFISARMYSLFYNAYHSTESMGELWSTGKLSRTTWDLWNLFEENSLLSTSDIRRLMGVTAKNGGSRVDRSIKELQSYFYITVVGSRRKINKDGEPYGWPASVYDKVVNWIPPDWLKEQIKIQPDETCEKILDKGMAIAIGEQFSRKQLAKKLKIG